MKINLLYKRLGRTLALSIATAAFKSSANPLGMTVASGSASEQQNGSQLNITTGQTTILNWNSFNIQKGETTSFLQPSSSSIVFNSIGSANPSKIWGNLTANGTVILANAHGFYFGPNSMIQVGGNFVATTAPLPPDLGAGASWQFTGLPPLAKIVNYGQIEAGSGKSLFLIAEKIYNHGELSAPEGNIGLYAGKEVLLSDRPDGRGLSASVTLPSGSVDNSGKIVADAGSIALQAQVVNQNGILQADSVRNQNGFIELVASDELKLGANSQILARGDNSSSRSAGGSVVLKSGNNFSDATGSVIETTGGTQGGNGGNVEISAPNILSLNSTMDAGAQTGSRGGSLLLDPVNIVLGSSGSGSVPDPGTVSANDGTGTLNLNVSTAFLNKNFSQILLQASQNIYVGNGTVNADGSFTPAGGITWNLSGTTGLSAGQLTLEAGGDIVFQNTSKITDAYNWSLTLAAGYDFTGGAVKSGVGNIYLNGGSGLSLGGTIQLSAGSINLQAGQSILVGSGSVFTTGGGSIFADAVAGDVNAGTSNGSSGSSQTSDYIFTASGARPNTILGGISTAAGGDVTLIAGNNIQSSPVVPSKQWPGASGTYGSGDVTIIAGNQITGNYNLANGVGTILAGAQVQSAQASVLQNASADPVSRAAVLGDLETAVTQAQNQNANIGAVSGANGPVTLSLIQGSWNLWAANNIFIKEVNNPNGAFNSSQSFVFNYAPDAAANFWAGNGIELVGGNLTRVARQNQNMPPIYAPELSLNAGAGGITVDRTILLDPSSEGSLQITTRNGGDLSGAVTVGSTVLNGITMSDSGSTDYTTFANGHAATPLHLNDPNPITLDISGDIQSFGLTVPTFANVNVTGNTYNFGFSGRNLSPSQTTAITVGGDITYRGNLTSVTLTTAIPAGLLDPTLSADPDAIGKLRYDPVAGTLTFIGVMTGAQLAFLLNPSIVVVDQFGQPVLDANGNIVTTPVALAPAQQAAIQQLYTTSQSATLGDQGLTLAGSGLFKISAQNIDLGISGGISVTAPDAPLAAISPFGANLSVTTSGNLEMTSTKIANESLLGGINVSVGGQLDVGGELTAPNEPKGIFTTSSGNVQVIANGDLNVDGSRIAAYNGGNITVESLTGNVDAGNGGSGYVSLNALELNPLTGQLDSIPASIPGSGILATTVAGSHAPVGNILVETPQGNISASEGGIVQLSFNGTDASQKTTELLAGYELQDGNGQRVLADNLDSGTPIRISENRDIDASGSGVIAENIIVKATGHLEGLFASFGIIIADPGQGFIGPTIFFSKGPVHIDAPTDPGNEGPGPIVISDGPTTGPSISPETLAVPVANNQPQTAKDSTEIAKEAVGQYDGDDDEQKKKRGGSLPRVSKTTGRVTVILPKP